MVRGREENLGQVHRCVTEAGKLRASLVARLVKNLPACGRPRFDPWVGKIPQRRAWQPTAVFLPGESPGTEGAGGPQSMGSQRVRHD